jgi:hypothetical protein
LKIAVIDTEHGSAAKYADRFDFFHHVLPPNSTPDRMVEVMAAAEDEGFGVLVIDSSSHEWDKVKDFVNLAAKNPRHRNNTWSAWSEGNEKQKAFINAILAFPGHIIATIRAKTEWLVEKDGDKSKPVRVGLTPDQGKGIEYEFDMLMLISPDHVAVIEKDRTGRYQDHVIPKPDETLGKDLSEWLRPAIATSEETSS